MAGASAAQVARRAAGMVIALERELDVARETERTHRIGHASEEQLGRTLELLPHGYRVFPDRKWTNRGKANIDFIVVGPSGLFFIDAKSWREIRIEQSPGGEKRVHRGDADETDKFAAFADLANSAEGWMADRIGLAPGEVHALAVFTNRDDIRAEAMGVRLLGERDCVREILRRGDRLTARQVELVEREIIDSFPPVEITDEPITLVIPSPALLATTASPSAPMVSEPEPLFTASEVNAMTLEAKLAEPIEEWRAFLDPSQSKVVRRSFNGPCRIRGAAGTGKTVVGLHRAAYLARAMPGRVLVTTFIRTLPDVLHAQLRRLGPEVVDRVDFHGVHEFAREILRRNGVRNRQDGPRASAAFARVWTQHGRGLLGDDERYWKEEIASVIKGRGLTSLDQYRECSRVGRKRRLGPEQKAAVWTLYEHYQRELQRENVWDFADVILHADAVLAAHPIREYSAVIVDEAQDLTCVMTRMLHRLVGDAPDGLTLIGDGQQTIYPGGFTLAEAGVSLAGRGVVLSTNYRNTVEIVEFAGGLVAGDSFVDIEGTDAVADGYSVARHGPAPVIVGASTSSANGGGRAAHDAAVVARVREVLRMPSVEPGDVGVLARYTSDVEQTLRLLAAAGIPAMNLEDYRGERTSRIRVGTIKRAKGLEFKQVLVVRAPRSVLRAAQAGGERSERDTLAARELYVAMTRARDGLWVGVG